MFVDILAKVRTYSNGGMDEKKIANALKFVELESREKLFDHSAPFVMLESILPFKPDEETIIATLLHKLYVSDFFDQNVVKNLFGERVLGILSGVKQLEDLPFVEDDKAVQVENLRNMILVMAKDIRVILVVLACRLYKMRNLENLMEDVLERGLFAKETMSLYVPIAARFGIYRMKSEFEDLVFMHSNPKEYKYISDELNSLSESCQISIAFVKERLDYFLKGRGVKAEVSGRIKNIYSIYKKLKEKGLSSLDDLYDIYAMRVVLPAKSDSRGNEEIDHLYAVLGLVHSEWKPLSSRFKDYLAVPKPNGYRSLHTVVLGLAPKDMDQPVEIQIRDKDMHRESEYGIASHWFYKESGRPGMGGDLRPRIDLIKGLEGIRSEFDLDYDVLKEVELDLFKDRIFILTPRGEVKDLPVGSIPIDFAYIVHTDVGNKCVMAKVNGKVVALDYELNNNDVVEIITRKDATPKLKWLSIVKTSIARNKIKSWFSYQNREEHLKEGRKLINEQLQRIGKPVLDQNYSILKEWGGQKLDFAQRESLLEEVGDGAKVAGDIVKKIYPYKDALVDKVLKPEFFKKRTIKGKSLMEMNEKLILEDQILIGGEAGLPVKIAACCRPKIGKPIIGYVTRGNSITIHRVTCQLLDGLDPVRIIYADWKGNKAEEKEKYLVGIKLEGVCRIGLMSDVTSVISALGLQIRDIVMKRVRNGVSEEYFLIEMDDINQFDKLVDKLEGVRGVLKVVRDDRFKLKN